MILGGQLRGRFEDALQAHIISQNSPLEIIKPMVYSLNSGGKRLRPLMLLTTLDIIDAKKVDKGLRTAIALEYIHTYSLIHDDLPAMDNDEIRRGQPTSHVKFDEATAILAGDALQTDAFAVICQDQQLSSSQRIELVTKLSQAAGSAGMVAGQLYDIRAEKQQVDLDQLQKIHLMKTGLLFIFAVQAAGIIAGVDQVEQELLVQFGHHFGVAYQIHNDLKDVVKVEDEADTDLHSDQANHKSTYPSLLGVQGTKEELQNELDQAHAVLSRLENKTKRNYYRLDQFLNPLATII